MSTPPLEETQLVAAVDGAGRLRFAGVLSTLRERPLLAVGVLITSATLILAVIGPMIGPYPPEKADASSVLLPPSSEHWFGTDSSGFDVFSRVIAAPRIDVVIALLATLISLALGAVIGLLVSYFDSWASSMVMRAADVVQAFPLFVLAMILVITSGSSLVALLFVIAFLNVPIFIRLVRSQVLTVKHRTFVEAGRTQGQAERTIAFRHVLPNCLEPCLIQASVTVGFSIILTAGLSFIGAGVRPPAAEWGAMISAGSDSIILGQWWPSVFPGAAMSLAVLGFAIVGEFLQQVVGRSSR
jgi:peptide/nickel transport system permease protein